MTGRFLRTLVVSLLIALVSAIALLFVFYAAKPPEPEILVNGEPVKRFANIDQTDVHLTLTIPHADGTVSAALILYGMEFQSATFDSGEVTFAAFVVPYGGTNVVLEMRRHIGPVTFRNRITLGISARVGARINPVLEVPAVTWSNRVEVSGTAAPGSRLTFLVDGEPLDSSSGSSGPGRVSVNPGGRFEKVLELPEPGEHTIQVKAERWSSEEEPLLSDEKTVRYQATLPPLVERKLAINIGFDEINWTMRARFRAGDPRLLALETGEASRETFLRAIFGDILLNRTSYSSRKIGNLRVGTDEDQTWIEVDSHVRSSRLEGISRLAVDRRIGSDSVADLETIQIRSSGPRLTGYFPAPTRVFDQTVLWTGSEAAEGSVGVFLQPASAPLSLRALVPSDIVPEMFESLIYKLIVLIPVFWFLVLLRDGLFGSSPRYTGLAQDIVVLGVLGIFSTLHYLVGDIGYLLDTHFGDLPGGWVVAQAVFTLAAILLLLGLVRLLAGIVKAAGGSQIVGVAAGDFGRIVTLGLFWGVPLHLFYLLGQLLRSIRYEEVFLLSYTGFVLAWLVCAAIAFSLMLHGHARVRAVLGRGTAITWLPALAALGAVLFLSYPQTFEWAPETEQFQQQFTGVFYAVLAFMSRVGSVTPLAAMVLACVALFSIGEFRKRDHARRMALLLFAGVLVGTGSVWFVVPVPLLIALLLFPVLVWPDNARTAILAANGEVILQDRAELLEHASRNATNHGSGGGWFGLGLFGLKEEEKKRLNSHKEPMATLPDGKKMPASELVFAFGPRSRSSDNALEALKVGGWGSLVLVFIYALPTFIQPRAGDDFPYLWALIRVFSVGGYWLIGAFFLGYFYESIKGTTGWKKGGWLALAISLALEPMSMVFADTVVDYAAIAVSVVQRFAYFMLVGFFAFDLKTFKALKTDKVAWSTFPQLTGLSVMQASLSLVIAGTGAVLTTVFSGQLATVLAQVAAALIPVISTVQPALQP
ncbi:hypothetical protein [Roseibium marinum]|uniref:Uncharacterized protein n=1 Tax=Roseibium marinum TaxID=281252 RepID=A0A2S3UKB5_9HYPH|nr:hypothetical protein [Roseibium marinum]POF28146.1 hypothetical protein CLV41_11780 [Roseibium marinum]